MAELVGRRTTSGSRSPANAHDRSVSLDHLYRDQAGDHSLERRFYMDEAVFRDEMERLFRRYWLFVGFVCEVPRRGDFLTYEIDGESLIVMQTGSGLRALFNHCRHRGSQLCQGPSGHVPALVCPYHQWSYDLEGHLVTAPGMDEGFDRSAHPLHAARVECVQGLIFVALSDEPPEFEPIRRELAPVLRPHALERTRIAHTLTWRIPANWKLVVENQRECYHCPGSHPEYVRAYYDADLDRPGAREEMSQRLEECRLRWEGLGIDGSTVSLSSDYTGPWYRANRTPFRLGYMTESLDGRPVAPPLAGLSDPDIGTARCNTYLNFWLHATGDHAAVVRLTPEAPDATTMRTTWLVRADAEEGRDYDVDRLTAFTLTQWRQDFEILVRQGRGVRSRRYQGGPLSPRREANVMRFLAWYLGVMSGSHVD